MEGEFAFIARHLRPLASAPGALGLVDDAALLDPRPGMQLVLTKDAMVAGVHFLEGDPPGRIAQKLLRVNLSDLAAMGAAPIGYLLTLARPRAIEDDWLAAFCAGLAADNAAFGISDGLLADLGHIVETTKLGAEIRVHLLPLSAAGLPGAQDAALSGGDDY